MDSRKANPSRREFMRNGVLGAASLVAWPAISRQQPGPDRKSAKILNYNPDMEYRRLGNTEIFLSVISLGGLGLQSAIAHHAIDRGVNLVHISEGYNGGRSIRELAKVLRTRRDQVYVALKDSFYRGSNTDIDDVLKTLNTDYVDFLMFNRHAESQVNDLQFYEVFQKWKAQGKVRFAGLTTHDNVKACVAAGIKCGLYTLIMPVLNQPSLQVLSAELRSAREKNIGIMAMKTMKGLDDVDLQTAYLKKILLNPAVTTVLKGFHTFAMFDIYFKAMRETFTSQEDSLLDRYALRNRSQNCMMCGECEQACPQGLGISTVLRCKSYYLEELHDPETALATYREIPAEARFSQACPHCRRCEAACPNSIQIVDQLERAHHIFTAPLV